MRARDYSFFAPRFLALAHRGGWVTPDQAAQENTLAAFRRAAALGYRYMETDVHLTKDHVLVAFHDDALDRLTGHPGRIADIDFAELQAYGDEPVPTLDELLDGLPDVCFNIDMKADDTVVPLAQTIRRHRAADRVCVASFNSVRLRRFQRIVGTRVPTSTGTLGVMWHVMPGLPGRFPGQAVALQVPTTRTVAGLTVDVVTPRLIARAHAEGLAVHVWTIDEAAEMERLIDLGVDGLVSNRIDVLKDVLQTRGLWS